MTRPLRLCQSLTANLFHCNLPAQTARCETRGKKHVKYSRFEKIQTGVFMQTVSSIKPAFQECIRALQTCESACQACLHVMLGLETVNDCPRCCIECASISQLCAAALARNSRFAAPLCTLCAWVCEWCEEQCLQYTHQHCIDCAAACRECAVLCRRVVE